MIVLDASALVELILGTSAGHGVAARIADPAVGLHVPHLADIEVVPPSLEDIYSHFSRRDGQ